MINSLYLLAAASLASSHRSVPKQIVYEDENLIKTKTRELVYAR